MFGLLVSGRLVDTNFRQVDQTHCVFDVSEYDKINHLVVFLTGQQPLPEGFGAGVYFLWPSSVLGAEPVWQYLGMIANSKPSAIFKISGLKTTPDAQSRTAFGAQSFVPNCPLTAQVGISVEPLPFLESLISSSSSDTEASSLPSALQFSRKMAENLFNYVASFAVSGAQTKLNSSETYVPFSSVQQWLSTFERRLQQAPNLFKV